MSKSMEHRIAVQTAGKPSKEMLAVARKWLSETRGSVPVRLAASLARLLDAEIAKVRLACRRNEINRFLKFCNEGQRAMPDVVAYIIHRCLELDSENTVAALEQAAGKKGT